MSYRQVAGQTKAQRSRSDLLRSAHHFLGTDAELYEQATIGKIAEAAGMSVATFYNYFHSKAAVATAIFLEDCEELFDWASNPGPKGIADLIEFGQRFSAMAHAKRWLIVPILGTMATLHAPEASRRRARDPSSIAREILQPLRDALAALIEAGKAAGELRTDLHSYDTALPFAAEHLIFVALSRDTDHPGQIASRANSAILEGLMVKGSATES